MSISWEEFGDKLIEKAKVNRYSISGQLEITSRCNLKCRMCYVCKPLNDIKTLSLEHSGKEWIKLSEEMRDAGVLYLLLTGGEVFLHRDFKEIYKEINMMGFNVTIYSNATMITPEIAKWLGRIPPSKIAITIYGASPDTYSDVCGCREGYDRVVHGIDLLQNEGITLKLRTTVIKKNIDDFYKLVEFAQKKNIPFEASNYISPRRDGCLALQQEERLSPEELAQFDMELSKYKNIKDDKSNKNKTVVSKNKNSIDINNASQVSKGPFTCTAGSCSFWVTWDGKMTPCSIVDSPASFPFKNGFESAWNDLKKQCDFLPSCKECSECIIKDYCIQCPARLKNETGFYDKPATYLCKNAQMNKKMFENMK